MSWEGKLNFQALPPVGTRRWRATARKVAVLESPELPVSLAIRFSHTSSHAHLTLHLFLGPHTLELGFTPVPGLPASAYHYGPVVWAPEDARGTAATEPAGPEPSHEGAGQRATKTRDSGEENYCGHQKDGQAGPDGKCWWSGTGKQGKIPSLRPDTAMKNKCFEES